MLPLVQDYWHYKFRNVDPDSNNHNSSLLESHSMLTTLIHSNGTPNVGNITNVDEDALTPLQLKWNSYLSIANMIPNVGMLMLNMMLGHKIPMRPRLLVSLVGIIILFILTDIMTQVNTDGFQNGFLSLMLAIVVLITACVGILQVTENS